MKHTSVWVKIIALSLITAFTAQIVLAADPQVMTYYGRGGKERGYIEQIIKSENEIQFRICESGPASCKYIQTSEGKNSFTLEQLKDLSSKQLIYTAGKSVQDAIVIGVTFWAAKKLLRPVGGLLKASYYALKTGTTLTSTAIRSLPVVVVVGGGGGFYFFPDETRKVVHWVTDLAIDGGLTGAQVAGPIISGVLEGDTDRLMQDAEQKAQELMVQGQRKAGEHGVNIPSVDEMSGMLTNARGRASVIFAKSDSIFDKRFDPYLNLKSSWALDEAAQQAMNQSVKDVRVENLEGFIRDLTNGLNGNYIIR